MDKEMRFVSYAIVAMFCFLGGVGVATYEFKKAYRDGYSAGALRMPMPQDAERREFYQIGHYFGSHRLPPHFDVNIGPSIPPVITLKAGETPPPGLGIEAKIEADDQSKSAPSTPSPSQRP
jgi:hypothetical protein